MFKPQDVNAILSTVESLDLANPLVQEDLVTKVTTLGASSSLFENVITYSAVSGGPAYLGEGNHFVMTSAEDDQIYLGSGNDLVNAGGGNNTIYAAGGNNFIVTGMGNDTIYVSEGYNFISTGTGNDTVYVGGGKADFALTRGAGSTTIIGFGSDDSIYFADGTTPDGLSFTIQNGDTLVTAGDDLLATLKWTQLNSVSTANTAVGFNTNIPRGFDNIPPLVDIKSVEDSVNPVPVSDYTSIAKMLWSSGETNSADSKNLARLLQDKGATAIEIAQAFNYGLGLNLETIVDALDDGTTFGYTDIARGLWNSGYYFDSKKLADLLWDTGASPSDIIEAIHYGIGLDLPEITIDLKYGITKSDGSNLDYTTVAFWLWKSGSSVDSSLNAGKLADLLWDSGALQIDIGQALHYGAGLDLLEIANALKFGVTTNDGASLNYTDVAVGLWNSGYSLDFGKLADLLWDSGALQGDIGQALHYGIGLDLSEIANALKFGVTTSNGSNLNYIDVAVGLWNSGYSIDTRLLAGLLWNTGTNQGQIGQAIKALGYDLTTIADAMDDGPIDFNAIDVAQALWNSGYELDTRVLTGLLWNEGISQGDIGQAIRSVGGSLAVIADAMNDGPINFNAIDVTQAVWNSGYDLDVRILAGLLWNEGISQGEIGQAIKSVGGNLADIADAMNDGPIDFNVLDVTQALWNSGYTPNTRELTGLLWNEGFSQGDIGQAIRSVGGSLATIADAMVNGPIEFNFVSVTQALWNSGYELDTRVLAGLLWNEGISQGDIGRAIRSVGGSLATIADAMDDGPIDFNVIDVAQALWNSGYELDTRVLAGLLWNEGISQGDIGQGIRSVGGDLASIADAMDDGPIDFNAIDVAQALWNSGWSINTKRLVGLLWNEGISQGKIGQAIKSVGGSLATIADAMVDGPIDFNFIDVSQALWNSGYSIDGGTLAALLWNQGASQGDIGQAMTALGFSNEQIGYAIRNAPGIGFNYSDVARAVWDSRPGVSDFTITNIVKSLGGDDDDIFGALREVGVSEGRARFLILRANFVDLFNKIIDVAEEVSNKVGDVVEDIEKSIPKNVFTDAILLPITLPTIIAVNTIESVVTGIVTGDVGAIVDGLKRVPVLGSAVGVIEGFINVATGNEKGALISAIDSALAFYGASNVITPRMVEFAVDVFWELKNGNYKGAASEVLNDLGLQKKVADVFVAVAWAMEQGSWKGAIDAALSEVGFGNAKELVTLAWNVIDSNYQDLIKVGFDLVGLEVLGINQSQANAFMNIVVAIRDRNPNQVADQLITLAGANASQVRDSLWIQDLRDGNPANDRQAVQAGLSELGFKNSTQWVNIIWAVKDGQYVNALSEVLVLGQFKDAQNWVKIINDLKQEKYLDALDTAFSLTNFPDGKTLAKAAVAIKNGNFIDAFYDGFDLIEGGFDVKEAFRALRDFNLQSFISSMIDALPLLIKLI